MADPASDQANDLTIYLVEEDFGRMAAPTLRPTPQGYDQFHFRAVRDPCSRSRIQHCGGLVRRV
jgi:hypothetical protein